MADRFGHLRSIDTYAVAARRVRAARMIAGGMTMQQVGDELDVSRERARQIADKGRKIEASALGVDGYRSWGASDKRQQESTPLDVFAETEVTYGVEYSFEIVS